MLNFITNEDGSSSLGVAKKLQAIMLDKKPLINPYVKYRILPDMAEARNSGGGEYTWYLILGQDRAARQSAEVTGTGFGFATGHTKATTRTLTVQDPLQYPKESGKVIPLKAYDKKVLDGIDFSPSTSAGIVKSLLVAEVAEDRAKITNITPAVAGVVKDKARLVKTTGTTAIGVLTELMAVSADYEDISPSNNRWGITTPEGGEDKYNSDYPATKYFHQNIYSYDKGEIEINMHPADITLLSKVNTEAGAGSEAQFLQFQNGTLTHINGNPVISNRWTPRGKAEYFIPGFIGTPDEEMLETNIYQNGISFTKITGMRGEHYYDSIILFPELITVVDITSFTGAAPAAINGKSEEFVDALEDETPAQSSVKTFTEEEINKLKEESAKELEAQKQAAEEFKAQAEKLQAELDAAKAEKIAADKAKKESNKSK